MGKSGMTAHDFQKNLAFGNTEKLSLLRGRIRRFYEAVFLDAIDIEQPSYEMYNGKLREKSGTDTQIETVSRGPITVQEKIRRPSYWDNRAKDVFVELKNGYRTDGKGWFYLYQDVDFLGYYFVQDENLETIHFVLYNNTFFTTVETLLYNGADPITGEKVIYPTPHFQKNKNGTVGGETSGAIITQRGVLKSCEVARFYLNNERLTPILRKGEN